VPHNNKLGLHDHKINKHSKNGFLVGPQKTMNLRKQLAALVEETSFAEVEAMLSELKQTKGVPISVFRASLSSFEIIVRYLKDEQHKSVNEVARLLKRATPTIYETYRNSKKKHPEALDTSDTSILIPFDLISQRDYSVLEHIVSYLREQQHLPLVKIAELLHRSPSTIKTTYWRWTKKR